MNTAALPSPKISGKLCGGFSIKLLNESMIFFSSASVITAAPHSTISVHSVSLLKIRQGFWKKNASFCTPPESVMTIWAWRSRTIISKNDAGGRILIFLLFVILSYNSFSRLIFNNLDVLGCNGSTTVLLSEIFSNALKIEFRRSGWSVLLSRWMVQST